MEPSRIYMAIGIILLAIIALLSALISGKSDRKKLSPLAAISFGFVLAGICFGEKRIFGYGLIGTGIVLAVIDIILKSRQNKKP